MSQRNFPLPNAMLATHPAPHPILPVTTAGGVPVSAAAGLAPPLFVDLDGTLIRSNLLWESFAAALRVDPLGCLMALLAIINGRAALKRALARVGPVDPRALPYRRQFVAWLRRQRAQGRRIILATSADRHVAAGVARHLGLFEQVLASDGWLNNKGQNKLAAIRAAADDGPFDYCGNSPGDMPIFLAARQAWVVGASQRTIAVASRRGNAELRFARIRQPHRWQHWRRALRPFHWLKNLLVLAPFFSAFAVTEWSTLAQALLAAVAMSLAASAGYLVNDLLDMQADRQHPRKRRRPFAAGHLTAAEGFTVALVLQSAALAIATWVGWQVVFWLLIYLVGTYAYSVFFKREPIIDVMMLAGLYATRMIVGTHAVNSEPSIWLLAFSVFFFFSLAMMKRCGELVSRHQRGESTTVGRGYLVTDLQMLAPLGIASGVAAVLVLALYVQSPIVQSRYPIPEALWLALVALLVWISRAWLDTMRGQMDDDPLIYAIRHRRGRLVLVMVIASFSLASLWGLGVAIDQPPG